MQTSSQRACSRVIGGGAGGTLVADFPLSSSGSSSSSSDLRLSWRVSFLLQQSSMLMINLFLPPPVPDEPRSSDCSDRPPVCQTVREDVHQCHRDGHPPQPPHGDSCIPGSFRKTHPRMALLYTCCSAVLVCSGVCGLEDLPDTMVGL